MTELLPIEGAERAEPMIDAKAAAAALRLPYYWFADPLMRERHRIPHYVLGRSVRYRLSELLAWAARRGCAGIGEENGGDAR